MKKRWVPIFQILIAIAAVALIVFVQIKNRPAPRPMDYQAISVANGETVALKSYAGSPILITAWTLDCTDCKENLNNLQQIWQTRGSKGLITLAVNVSPTDTDAAIQAFAAQAGLNIPIWHDKSNQYASIFKTTKIPNSLLIDRKGAVNASWDGVPYYQSEMIILAIDFVINSSP